jgi:hypothetical protein
MIDTHLVAETTTVSAKGDSAPVDISAAQSRVFLLSLNIVQVIEQESLEVSVFGSADGAAWSAKPLLSFPQKFYRGQHPLLLDLTADTATKFLRAHWEVNRWGRGTETPKFEFSLGLKEVPASILQETASRMAGRG